MEFKNLGLLGFQEFLEVQDRLIAIRKHDEIPDTILFAEHPITISLKSWDVDAQLMNLRYYSPYWLRENGIPIVKCRRGGSIAVHAPGILGCYFILKLKEPINIDHFFRAALSLSKRVLARANVMTRELPDEFKSAKNHLEKSKYRGLWVIDDAPPRKIVSIGIGISRAVTSFGMNINISPEERVLKLVYPCGIREYELTSSKKEGGSPDVKFYIQNLTELASQYFY